MNSENGLAFTDIQNKIYGKTKISTYLNVILHFKQKLKKTGTIFTFLALSQKKVNKQFAHGTLDIATLWTGVSRVSRPS